ncbi:MAG: hypothetical protein MPJ50_11745, partial [Pirellulales bacterium]|nr:hypothetical protein [Pirellulales bacterium]
PYTECSNCRRDGTMLPYDYRRVFDYPWHSPNYAWGSPFVSHAWWPEVEAMVGPGYLYTHNPHAADDAGGVLDHGAPTIQFQELTPIASPPFPTPMQRKIIRID